MKKLTSDERYVIDKALTNVIDCMEYDEGFGEYTDGGRFILSLEKEELKALKTALKKLQ